MVNAWERAVRDVLKEATGEEFQRVPNSGAIGTNYRKEGSKMREDAIEIMSGDIISPKNFQFSVECKAYNDIEFHRILMGDCAKLDLWIEQCRKDADASKKKMLIFIKIDRKVKMVVYDKLEIVSDFENYFLYKDRYIIVEMETFVEKIINNRKEDKNNEPAINEKFKGEDENGPGRTGPI